MNTDSLNEFPALATVSRRAVPAMKRRRQVARKALREADQLRTSAPSSGNAGSFFTINDGDSSDDDTTFECGKSNESGAAQVFDLENLFEFDTSTLVKLASQECGIQADAFWESDVSTPRSVAECDCVAEAESVVVQRLRKECEQKDKQIEVLKHTVCELLVWKSRITSHEPWNELHGITKKPVSAVSPGTVSQKTMRADAPEFVFVGIPSLGLNYPGVETAKETEDTEIEKAAVFSPRSQVSTPHSQEAANLGPIYPAETRCPWKTPKNLQGERTTARKCFDTSKECGDSRLEHKTDSASHEKLKNGW